MQQEIEKSQDLQPVGLTIALVTTLMLSMWGFLSACESRNHDGDRAEVDSVGENASATSSKRYGVDLSEPLANSIYTMGRCMARTDHIIRVYEAGGKEYLQPEAMDQLRDRMHDVCEQVPTDPDPEIGALWLKTRASYSEALTHWSEYSDETAMTELAKLIKSMEAAEANMNAVLNALVDVSLDNAYSTGYTDEMLALEDNAMASSP